MIFEVITLNLNTLWVLGYYIYILEKVKNILGCSQKLKFIVNLLKVNILKDKFEIRTAKPEEFDQAAKVMLEAYEEYSSVLCPEEWESYAARILDVYSRAMESDLIIAKKADTIVGAVTFFPILENRTLMMWPPDWTGVRLVAVVPKNRREGLGKMLIAECIKRSREQGAVAVGLHSNKFMETAVEMYRNIGFTRVKEFDIKPNPKFTVMAFKFDLLNQ